MVRFVTLLLMALLVFSCSSPLVSSTDSDVPSGVTVLFSSEENDAALDRAVGSSTGYGYIYDLKTSVRDSNNAPSTMDGYTKIPVDLNEGAGGKWIYLYYKKSASANTALCYLNADYFTFPKLPWAGSYPTGNKNASHPYCDYLGRSFANGGWTDLNQGSGGKYIYLDGARAERVMGWILWCARNGYNPGWTPNLDPIKDILIISSNGSLSSYPGWNLIGVDLNKGAGGKYIYLCYKK